MRVVGITGAVLEPIVDSNMATRAVESESPGSTKWSGVKTLDRVLEAQLEALKVVLGVAELLISV